MSIAPLLGRPGVSSSRQAQYRNVFLAADRVKFFPGGGVLDGTACRDYGNALNLFLLRPGLLMGRITATKKWAPSVVGVNVNAYTSGGTSVTVSAAQAVEIVRRVGATGNLYYVGPPAAAGTVATLGPIAFSAVNTSTGVITTASLGANLIAGGLVVVGDGSEVPRSLIPDGYGIEIPADSSDCDFPHIPVEGDIESAKILDWPTDTSLQKYVRDSLCANGAGLFTFNDLFSAA